MSEQDYLAELLDLEDLAEGSFSAPPAFFDKEKVKRRDEESRQIQNSGDVNKKLKDDTPESGE